MTTDDPSPAPEPEAASVVPPRPAAPEPALAPDSGAAARPAVPAAEVPGQAPIPAYYMPPPGYAQPYPYGYQMQPPTNGMAIAALVTSCVMLVSCMPLSVVGAVLGHIARRQIRETGESGDGLALAAVILGWIGLLLPLIFIAAFFALGVSGVFDEPSCAC
jgi:hypothetical protein